jgi:phosphatidate cytidylyltransferase
MLCALKQHTKPRKWSGIVLGIVGYIFLFFYYSGHIQSSTLWILAALTFIFFCTELIRLDQNVMTDLSTTLMGWIYVIFPFALVNKLANITGEFNYELPIGFFLILWANDSGAYFIGKYLGKTKLYEKVSPNKTWEGLFGGFVFAFIVAYFVSQYFHSANLQVWIIISLIISIFGNLGDLFESQFKRSVGAKDSGNFIPGHGGVLDRFDGLLIALPITIGYLALVL